MDEPIVLSSGTDDSDAEIIESRRRSLTRAPRPQLGAAGDARACDDRAKMAVKIEHQGSIPPELNVFERVNFFSSPPVDWTESYAYTESEQELDGFTQCDPQASESEVRGGLRGTWELTGDLLDAQLSRGLKISQHPASPRIRRLVQTSPAFATGNPWTADPGRAPLEANSDLSDRSCCDTTEQPRPPASDINDSDHRSLTYESELDLEDTSYLFWQDNTFDGELRFERDPGSPILDDATFVCPAALSKLLSGQAQALSHELDEDQGAAVALPNQSLRMVYITIDENRTEGTLELLSDLLQPGFFPPTDITAHLVRGILLHPQSPYHFCVEAFRLLIRTQRYHIVTKATVPWDWELLNTVMDNQVGRKKLKSSVVAMFLQYVVQTLEDDFNIKASAFALRPSIARETLSCDYQFSHVRDVLKWLFAAISKSTDPREGPGADKELEEQRRIVSIFQRMLSLAVEVDRFPTLHSEKVSRELFLMLVDSAIPRAHRMLLLESLQSTMLTNKLVIHLLDYACAQKACLPMSLSLLLHFMKNCTLELDPEDGAERWRRWEELGQLLWMLLLSYNKAAKGSLSSSAPKQRGSAGPYGGDDSVSRSAVLEAGQALLSRSRADAGQELPPHVEEAFSNLQDYLLEMCQS